MKIDSGEKEICCLLSLLMSGEAYLLCAYAVKIDQGQCESS